jgi:hypothetical protein
MMRSPSMPLRAVALVWALGCGTSSQAQTEPAPWVVAGRQGIIRLVIVPMDKVQDRAAYDAQIAVLCKEQETCFLNFFSNSTKAPVAVPLPDAIDREATAVLRRSAKQGVDSFRWSCRLKRPDTDCF